MSFLFALSKRFRAYSTNFKTEVKSFRSTVASLAKPPFAVTLRDVTWMVIACLVRKKSSATWNYVNTTPLHNSIYLFVRFATNAPFDQKIWVNRRNASGSPRYPWRHLDSFWRDTRDQVLSTTAWEIISCNPWIAHLENKIIQHEKKPQKIIYTEKYMRKSFTAYIYKCYKLSIVPQYQSPSNFPGKLCAWQLQSFWSLTLPETNTSQLKNSGENDWIVSFMGMVQPGRWQLLASGSLIHF